MSLILPLKTGDIYIYIYIYVCEVMITLLIENGYNCCNAHLVVPRLLDLPRVSCLVTKAGAELDKGTDNQ